MAIQRDERQVLTQPSGRLIREFRTQLPMPDGSGVQAFAKGLGDVGEQEMRRTATEETKLYAESLDFGKDENGNFVKPQAPESFGSFRRELFNELVDRRYTTEVLLDHDNSVAKIYAENKAAGNDPGVALAKAEADMKGRLEGVDPRVRGSVELGMRKNITQYNTQAVAQSAANAERSLITDTVGQIEALSTRMIRAGAVGNTADETLLRSEIETKRQLLVRAGRLTDTPESKEIFWNSIQANINVRRALQTAINDPKFDPQTFPSEINRLQRIVNGEAADNETAFGFKKSDFDKVTDSSLKSLTTELNATETRFRQQYAVSARMQKVQSYLGSVDAGIRRQTFGMSDDDLVVAFNQDITNLNTERGKQGLQPISALSAEGMRYLVDRHGFLPGKMYESTFNNVATLSAEKVEFAAKLYQAARSLPDDTGANTIDVTGQIVSKNDSLFLENYLSSRGAAKDPANALDLTKRVFQEREQRAQSADIEMYAMSEYKRFTQKSDPSRSDFEKDVSNRSDIKWTELPMGARLAFMKSVQENIVLTGNYERGIQLAAQSFKKNWVVDPTNPINRDTKFEKNAYIPRGEAFPMPMNGQNESVPNWANGYVGAILSKYGTPGVDKTGKPVEGSISITGIPDPVPVNSLAVGKNLFFQSTKRGMYDASRPWFQQDNVNPSFQMVYFNPETGAGPAVIHVRNSTLPLEIFPHAEAKAQHEKFSEAARANNTRLNQIDSNARILRREFPGIGFMSGASADMQTPPVVGMQQVQKPMKPVLYDQMGRPTTEFQIDDVGNRIYNGVELFRQPDPDAMVSPAVKDFINRQAPQRQSSLGITGVIALGTNDGNPDAAYKGAIQAIETAKAQGINPVIVLPNAAEGNRFKPISDAVRRAAEEKGVQFEVLAYAANDPLHLDPISAKTLADKYQGAVFFGDSNAVRIANAAGMKAQNRAIVDAGGMTVAREGAASAEISKLISGYRPGGRQQTAGLATDAKSILDFVARPESGGNYNAFLGNANNQTVDLTNMTLNEVMAFQRQMVRQGKESGAVGRYQIIGSTLQGLIKEMKLDPATTKFTAETQDKMAMQLLERRGYAQWKAGNLSDEEFANRIAQEWAGVPVVTGRKAGSSFYAGVGSNKAGVSSTAFLNAIKSARGAG